MTEKVPNKAPAIVSVVLTIIILIIFGILSILFELLAANGATESQGMTAIGISLACQSVGAILIGIFSWWLTNLLILKFNWNKIIAVILAVISGILLGVGISFLSLIISFPLAGIK
ncbi:MAG: hypothetical protein H7Y59_18530 [Anaerolineales bacterium]|nr:hypothetical protein [Anaerolineales bacterium]